MPLLTVTTEHITMSIKLFMQLHTAKHELHVLPGNPSNPPISQIQPHVFVFKNEKSTKIRI